MASTASKMSEREIELSGPLDLPATLVVSGLKGPGLRVGKDGLWRATRTPAGPVTVRMALSGRRLSAQAWGPGVEWALERLPDWIGENDQPAALQPQHLAVRQAARAGVGMRMAAVGTLVEVLVAVILGQKVTGAEAGRSYRQLVARYGEPAPGPGQMRLPPAPDRLAELAYYDFHPLGVEQKRAETILRVCRRAARLELLAQGDLAELYQALHSIPGVGPWTSACALRVVRGDPDAVPVGDFHVPHQVAWALAGQPRATDQRMLELLEPYAGQRGRVVRLLERFGPRPPSYGPRMPVRDIRPL